MPIIETRNLSKTYLRHRKAEGLWGSVRSLLRRQYEKTEAVESINFKVEEGELVGFLGPNGAGKTTTLKILCGLLNPTGGDAKVLGYTPWERRNEFRRQFALVMGNKSQLWFDIPAIESLKLNKEIYGVEEKAFRERLAELSELLGIQGLLEVPVRNLSLGERMKMELCACLIHRPKILFLDEPTIGLDVISQKKIRDFLKDYNQRFKTTVMLTSHYMADIQEVCDRVMVINQGRLMFDGPLEDIPAAQGRRKRLKVMFRQAVERSAVEPLGKILEWEPPSLVLEAPEAESAQAARHLLTDFPVADIAIEEVPIEETIRELFEKTARPK
jgi:ABC-2 type transport system ATP-binding protein